MGGSSSHNRRANSVHRNRRGSRTAFRPTSTSPSPSTSTSLTFDAHALTPANPGFRLLVKSGYVPGTPLGASPGASSASASSSPALADGVCTPGSACSDEGRSGFSLTEPIPIVVRAGRSGLGSDVATSAPEDWRGGHAESVWEGGLETAGRGRRSESVTDALSFTRDPLRPRCRYNSEHVVADLKALQAHEKRCPCKHASGEEMEVRRVVGFDLIEDGMEDEVTESEGDDMMSELSEGEEEEDLAERFGLGLQLELR